MGAPKIQTAFFLEHQWRLLNGYKDKHQCLDNLVDFQMAFKMGRKIISTKAKRSDSLKQIELEKNI